MTVSLIPLVTDKDKFTLNLSSTTTVHRYKRFEKGSFYQESKNITFVVVRVSPDSSFLSWVDRVRWDDEFKGLQKVNSLLPNNDFIITCYAIERLTDNRIGCLYFEQGLCDLFDLTVQHERRNPVTGKIYSEMELNKFAYFMAKAVAWLHSAGLVHQDIKLENYILTVDERCDEKIKLIDFESLSEVDGKDARLLFVTPNYTSPDELAIIVNRLGCLPMTYPPEAKDQWQLGIALLIFFDYKKRSLPPWIYKIKGESYVIANALNIYETMRHYTSRSPNYSQLLAFKPENRCTAAAMAQKLAIAAGIVDSE